MILYSSLWFIFAWGTPNVVYVSLPDHDGNGFADETYDYIVVGGGGVGCVVARTLSDGGFKTLLIERGGLPDEATKSRKGIAKALLGNDVQTVITSTGVRSHIAAVLGGGTSLNYGVWIEENDDYFDAMRLETGLGTKLEPLIHLMNSSVDWVRDQIVQREARARDSEDSVLEAYTATFYALMRENFGPFVGRQDRSHMNTFWKPSSLLNEAHGKRTSSARLALEGNENLTILLNSMVISVDWREGNTADCAVYRTVSPIDLLPIGAVTEYTQDRYGLDGLFWSRYLRNQLQPSLLDEPLKDNRTHLFPYRACLNNDPNSRIVVAAGAIHSPLIAMRSGLGPAAIVSKMANVRPVAFNQWVGQGLQDRPMLPLSFFLDGWEPEAEDTGWVRMAAMRKTGSTYFPLEEITGGPALQSSLIAARVMFPVKMRSGFWAEIGHYLMKRCVLNDAFEIMGRVLPIVPENGLKEDIVNHACRLFSPQARCFRNAVSWVTFVSDVHSRGSITLDPSKPENPILQVNYFADSRDRMSMRENVQNLLRMLTTGARNLKGLTVADSDDWCPSRIFDSDLTLFSSVFEMLIHQDRITRASTFIPAAEALRETMPFRKNSSVPLASFPQIWPDPEDDEGVDKFIESYFTSMWHLAGSMSMGRVVDENLDVYNVKRLTVLDSSVLPFLTRMNPSATLLGLGRAGALLKIQLRTSHGPVRQFNEL
eukprot:Gregarina_sp_Poly_1__339@NODE_1081_length_5162_cov_147_512659_g479_i2_p1_GENE_NODE_1081_length_5162_cov_147_512659_g479_i2NODE_1081_length_5162_cov_147_512659_g479_i2_p1_ORF_typecomplete_len711_score76_67GMC_oxred_N/PF00732_19/7_5e20GMC_oxred_N/PF00732_19/4_5e08GMC_oxred_C/PF05199_13/9_6e27DAO/PF01266_24/5_1e06FAD_binding_2/PF00890_24/2_7e05Pyr_redox_2/PF07992_14/0_0018Lycopene_cycl/PF05834_12/0_0025FAD_oxidored/PF12831_7/0_013GIDA/PF01134_22/0_013Thi4/PF01946_17/0_024Pyr_redox/PF00070_27/0_039F